ncbi:transporter substrate-binding domain-containing protein [Psittacicella hinzii]|uniref:Uncharacterized protein n=1 Tax=Psittacicella hinzii TaxID=2028575 RepID=A0A3A1YJI3_9GAMM|nr:transporter substrate-binding domain-containing protein [Psittacicella hinzii]RIY38433.1 hypothetical protein CKF58_04230 [Psittacicella hinzii]
MTNKFSVYALAAVTALSTLTTNAFANGDKTYVVATEAGYAPYEYLDSKGHIVGFDIDLINYVCKHAGIKCKVENQGFDALIPNLKFKKVDIAIAAITVTPERAKQVAFSQEYLPGAGYSYLTLTNNNYASVNDLKAVGYQNGTLAGKYLSEKTKAKTVTYDTYDTALLDLKAGRINALFADAAVVAKYAENDKNYKVYGEAVVDPILGQGLAIAVHPKNKDLLAKINAALAEAKSSGFIEQLKAKYGVTHAE